MADDSVKSILKRVESRTDKLEPALKKLSESLDKIADSFAAGKKETASREDLLQKFKAPFMQGVKPGGVSKDPNTNLLEEIKNTLRKNQEKTFPLFESIEKTLKNIEQKGGMLGGSGGLLDGLGGKDKGKTRAAPGKAGAAPGKAAEKGAGKAAGTLGKAARFAKAIPGVGLAAAAGMGVYDAVTGFSDEGVAENLGIEGRKATFGEKLSSAGGSVISGLTFGLMDKKAASRGIAGLFGAGPDEKAAATPSESTAGAIAAANLGKNPSAPIPEEDRKKAQETFQKALKGELPIGGKPGAEVKPEGQIGARMTGGKYMMVPGTTLDGPIGPLPTVDDKATVSATKEEPKKEAAVKSAPSQKPASKKSGGASVKEQMEGDENLEALQRKRGELQSLYSDYRDAKAKVAEKLAGDREKYPQGFIDDPSDPEYAPELKAVDEQFKPQIEALEKEVEELSKKPGIKEAQARAKAEDERFESDDFGNDEDTFKGAKSEGTTTVTATETVTGGGSTITRETEAGKNKREEQLALEKEINDEVQALANTRREEGQKRGGLQKDERYKAIMSKYDEKSAKINEKYAGQDTYEQLKVPGEGSTTTSTTVSDMSQENADMKAEASGGGQPVVITNNNSTSSNQQTVSPVRTSPRPSNNSFERKQMETAVY